MISELQSIYRQHQEVEKLLKNLKKSKASKSELVVTDAKGNVLRKGNSVNTLTKGKYYEWIAKVMQINPQNHIDIKYKNSKKGTW